MFPSCHLGRDGGMKPRLRGQRGARDGVTRVQRAGNEDGGVRSGLEGALSLHIRSGKDKKC